MMSLGSLIRLLFVVFGALALREGWTLGIGSLRAPGPGLWPFLLGALLLGLVLLEFIVHARAEDRPAVVGRGETLTVLPAVVALGLFVSILDLIGFVTAALLLVGGLLFAIHRRGWRESILVSVVAVLASWSIFTWLGVPLPRGRLW